MTKKEKLQKKLDYFAKKHLGKSYKYGAPPSSAPKIFDCSTFIQYLYKRIRIDLPRTALDQAHLGRKIDPKKEKLEIGDLILLKVNGAATIPNFLKELAMWQFILEMEK